MKKFFLQSPNFSKYSRNSKDIKFVIIHYTGMQSEIESLKRLTNRKAKVSCHYFINKKGDIVQLVKDNKIAWHAGRSRWKNYKNLNKNSIGIELVNKGHRFGYENFSNFQIKSLIYLCKKLKNKYKIDRENFLGHSDIAPFRKNDPGEKFSWKKMSEFGIGTWYKLNKKKLLLNKTKLKISFFKNLYIIGYRYFKITKRAKKDQKIILAFQRRYMPRAITGKIDQKTMKISQFLANNKN
tara:strand:+ start:849 stop:1565 length:717 start_codon:yes stop_codon:yes gene_type:complete